MTPTADEVRQELAALPRLDTPAVRTLSRRYSRVLAREPPKIVLRFVRSLLDDAGWAERLLACEVLASHEGAFGLIDDRLVTKMAVELSDWGSVDLVGVTVLGQAWRAGLVSDAKILAWARSPDRWRRRLALVATVPLNSRARGGTGDAQRTLRVCRLLLGDKDDMVVKAMSWALRELAKREPAVVEEFLSKESSRLSSRVKREVLNKLRTGLKSPQRGNRARRRDSVQ
ncbi:MAG TPA: DNA alkylation repair protein [Gemmatimonadaceae bacterium]|nr:DNA alkylation repair protein [Gemmatimonadaceae bacterium]